MSASHGQQFRLGGSGVVGEDEHTKPGDQVGRAGNSLDQAWLAGAGSRDGGGQAAVVGVADAVLDVGCAPSAVP
jgi:hypothetical protein